MKSRESLIGLKPMSRNEFLDYKEQQQEHNKALEDELVKDLTRDKKLLAGKKSLFAVRGRDGWYVSIIEKVFASSDSQVHRIIAEHGFKVKRHDLDEDRIYAD